MKIYQKTVRNQEGSAIIIVIFLLAIVTIIGISATNTTDVELNIVGNDRLYRRSFYGGESVGFAASKLVSDIVDTSTVPPPKADPKDGIVYYDANISDFYDEVLGLNYADYSSPYDTAPDIYFTLGGVDPPIPPLPVQPVGLPEVKVKLDLKRLKSEQPAGEAAEFGTGAEGLGGRAIVVIPYAFSGEGEAHGAKVKIRSMYFKFKDKKG